MEACGNCWKILRLGRTQKLECRLERIKVGQHNVCQTRTSDTLHCVKNKQNCPNRDMEMFSNLNRSACRDKELLQTQVEFRHHAAKSRGQHFLTFNRNPWSCHFVLAYTATLVAWNCFKQTFSDRNDFKQNTHGLTARKWTKRKQMNLCGGVTKHWGQWQKNQPRFNVLQGQ